VEGDLLRALAGGLPRGDLARVRDKLVWGLALYTPADTESNQTGGRGESSTVGRRRGGSATGPAAPSTSRSGRQPGTAARKTGTRRSGTTARQSGTRQSGTTARRHGATRAAGRARRG
jgi:hypothetical protein